MRDLIVFEIDKNLYALSLEYIERIIAVPEITIIPGEHSFIDGMISYEGKIVKVINFRKMMGMISYDKQLEELFVELKNEHQEWLDALVTSAVENTPFTQTKDPHKCRLGEWLDTFISYDDSVTKILKELNIHHKKLHNCADSVLDLREKDEKQSLTLLQTDVTQIYEKTIHYIDEFIEQFSHVADSLQKLLIYQTDDEIFAIKVDDIIDISAINESNMVSMDDVKLQSDYINLKGVIELDNKLVNIIEAIKFPLKEVI